MEIIWHDYEILWGSGLIFLGVWTYSLGVWTYILGVWTYIVGVWTYILDVWTYMLSVWTYTLGIWTYTLGARADGRTGGRAAGRPGRVTEKHGERIHFGNMYPDKTWILYIPLNTDFGVFLQKRRAPKNDEDWSGKCAEVSHVRPTQARKQKLLKHLI